MIKLVDYFVNRRLRFGYDIGRGFVVGEEELLHRYDRIKLVHNKVAEELKKRLDQTRIDVIRSLGKVLPYVPTILKCLFYFWCSGLIRKEHPGVALSVKTDQATRSVLNHCQDVIKQMLSNGLLDEVEAHKLLQVSWHTYTHSLHTHTLTLVFPQRFLKWESNILKVLKPAYHHQIQIIYSAILPGWTDWSQMLYRNSTKLQR